MFVCGPACSDGSHTAPSTDTTDGGTPSATDSASQPDADATQSDAGDGSGASIDGCRFAGTSAATARCLRPTLRPEHYVAEALAYFDTLDVDADRASVPQYHPDVARWEWPPWLLLTGYGADVMIDTAETLRQFDPSTVPVRDCRFFETQPFARCRITFEYEEGPCPIYEEFVFDDAGRTTFIEAWSDLDGLRPMPVDDPWGERSNIGRLSTRIPGLGSNAERFDLNLPELVALGESDPDVAEFRRRGLEFWATWFEELGAADEDFFARGCGW